METSSRLFLIFKESDKDWDGKNPDCSTCINLIITNRQNVFKLQKTLKLDYLIFINLLL